MSDDAKIKRVQITPEPTPPAAIPPLENNDVTVPPNEDIIIPPQVLINVDETLSLPPGEEQE